MTEQDNVVRSPHCPNRGQSCGACAWGFTKRGAGEVLSAGPVDLALGYQSDCGTVALFRDDVGRVGAVRDGLFYPGISGNPAYERYVALNSGLLQAGASS
jgi:hypothetical protein